MPHEVNKYPPGFNAKRLPQCRAKTNSYLVHRASKQQWYLRCTKMQQRTAAVPREPSIATPQKSRKVHGHSRLLEGLSNSGGSARESPMAEGTASTNMYKCLNYDMSGANITGQKIQINDK